MCFKKIISIPIGTVSGGNHLLIVLLILLISLGCTSNPKPDLEHITAEDRERLRFLKEVEWPKAYRQQDTLLLDRILGEDFQMIDAQGNWYTKQDELQWIKEHSTSYDSFYYEIKRLEVLDNGTAIICGTGHLFNDTVSSIYQSSNVLIKRDSQWKAVLSHVSGIK